MAFGKLIKELREENGLFLREVGATLELENPIISKVENEEVTAKKTFRKAC